MRCAAPIKQELGEDASAFPMVHPPFPDTVTIRNATTKNRGTEGVTIATQRDPTNHRGNSSTSNDHHPRRIPECGPVNLPTSIRACISAKLSPATLCDSTECTGKRPDRLKPSPKHCRKPGALAPLSFKSDRNNPNPSEIALPEIE